MKLPNGKGSVNWSSSPHLSRRPKAECIPVCGHDADRPEAISTPHPPSQVGRPLPQGERVAIPFLGRALSFLYGKGAALQFSVLNPPPSRGRVARIGSQVRGPALGALIATFIVSLLLSAAPVRAKDYPPEVLPPKAVTIPSPTTRVLPNGLEVVVVERHTLPLITLRLVVEAGAERDPAGLEGTAALVNSLLTEGTARRSSHQLAEAIDAAGGLVDSSAEWDSSFLSLSVLSDQADLAFDLMSDMAAHPAFQPAEIERQRTQTLSGLKVAHDDPVYVADTVFQELIFAGTAYSHPEDGTLESVPRIRAEDLRNFHTRYYQPSNCILAVVGDITSADAFARALHYFSEWRNSSPPPEPAGHVTTEVGAREPPLQVMAIDKPDAVQTEIRIGNLGVPRNSPDYVALTVANEILGGPSENRLFKALRSREGLTYGASSDLVCHRLLGSWVSKTFTRTSETVKSTHLALEQMKSLRDHDISRGELETAQSYLVGHLALDFETSDEVASHVLESLQNGLPVDYWSNYPNQLQALTTDDVRRVSVRYLDPDHEVIVLVGQVANLKKDLKKLGQARIIPLNSLDFAAVAGERPSNEEGN